METQDKVVILEGLSTVSAHEEWTALSISGQRPKPRYEVSNVSPCGLASYFQTCRAINLSFLSVYYIYFCSIDVNFGCCSMGQLYYKTKCIYLVETTMGVILVTFRLVKLNVIMQHVICMRSNFLLAWTWRHMNKFCRIFVTKSSLTKCFCLYTLLSELTIHFYS